MEGHCSYKMDLNQAILSGDSMLILSYALLEKYDPEIQKELLKLFNETALLICEGQQLDLDFEQKNDIDYENYLKMIKYKTAVLLASSLKMEELSIMSTLRILKHFTNVE